MAYRGRGRVAPGGSFFRGGINVYENFKRKKERKRIRKKKKEEWEERKKIKLSLPSCSLNKSTRRPCSNPPYTKITICPHTDLSHKYYYCFREPSASNLSSLSYSKFWGNHWQKKLTIGKLWTLWSGWPNGYLLSVFPT